MRFNEFNKITEDINPKSLPPWAASSALNKFQDPADVSHQQTPAYQRAGRPDPYMSDISKKLDTLQAQQVKPRINAKDYEANLAKQKELQQQLKDPRPAVWKDPRNIDLPASKSPPAMNTNLQSTDVGKIVPGEPTKISSSTPTQQVSPFKQAMDTVANIRKGMGRAGSNEYTNVYAPIGPTNFQNKQYIKDLETELAKTPNDPTIKAELDRMNKIEAPKAQTATVPQTSSNQPTQPATTPLNPITSKINTSATSRGMVGRGGQTQITPATTPPTPPTPPTTNVTQPAPTTTAPAVKPTVSTGTSTPAQSAYKGSAGAQAIQQANPDKITDVNKIKAGDTIKVGDKDYTIQQGDTLDQIAKNQLPTANTQQTEESSTIQRIKSLAGLK